MKQHLGFSKAKVQSNPLSVTDCNLEDADATATASIAAPVETRKLEQQIAKLQSQVASLQTSWSSNAAQSSPKPSKKMTSKPKTPSEPKAPPPGEFTSEKRPCPGY